MSLVSCVGLVGGVIFGMLLITNSWLEQRVNKSTGELRETSLLNKKVSATLRKFCRNMNSPNIPCIVGSSRVNAFTDSRKYSLAHFALPQHQIPHDDC